MADEALPSSYPPRHRRIERTPAASGRFHITRRLYTRRGVLPFISTTDGTMNRKRILRFGLMIFQTSGLDQETLVHIVRARKRYSTHFRAAALRNLICDAPLAVTGGRPFAERRRRVRRHYGV